MMCWGCTGVRGKTAVLYLEKRMSETNYAAYVNRNHHKISFEKFFFTPDSTEANCLLEIVFCSMRNF